MIKIIAKLVVKEECIGAFHETAAELVEKSRGDEGNISYSLNQSLQNPREHCFIEFWKDQASIDQHNAQEHFTTLLPRLAEMAEGEMRVDLFQEVSF